MLRRLVPLLLLLSTCLPFSGAQADSVKVITSIKPLQLIAAALLEGVSEPGLLVPVGASPHSYAMKPSDLMRLREADVVFWVGPEMEPFLQKILSEPRNGTTIRHFTETDVVANEAIDGGIDDHADEPDQGAHDHASSHDNDHSSASHQHSNDSKDPHIWLSPARAVEIARIMAQVLSASDVANKDRYNLNLQAFETSLGQVVVRNQQRLSQPMARSMFVFHDAYGHLEEFYGLQISGIVTITPEMQPGTRHLIELRKTLGRAGHSCLFTEPQFDSAILLRLVDNLNVRLAELDPLASDVPLGPDGFVRYQAMLIDNIVDCLSSTTQ